MNIIKLENQDQYRIVVISDVHGYKDHLKALLDKTINSEEDILIILGDFINRGLDSVETLEYVMTLSKRKNTYVLKGNHEYFIHTCLEDMMKVGDLHRFLKNEYYETIIHTILKAEGFSIHDITAEELHEYHEHHAMNYLKSLPIMLEIDNHIFVHGGYNQEFKSEGQFLKYDHFNDLSEVQEKKIVVGHWPTCNLRYYELNNEPYFNDDKNLIFIDGALGVQESGELNALIIEKKDGQIKYDFDQYHTFRPAKVIQTHCFSKESLVYVNYPHYEFELISQGEEMSICRHLHSGMLFTVFNSLLEETEGKYQLRTSYYNNFLNLEMGDQVYVCESYDDCVLVKYKKEFGWLKKDQIAYD